MWQLSNITHTLPRKGIIWHIVNMCVGEVLLKQWKQGNTWFGKTRKRPLEIGVLFYGINCKVDIFSLIKTKYLFESRLKKT